MANSRRAKDLYERRPDPGPAVRSHGAPGRRQSRADRGRRGRGARALPPGSTTRGLRDGRVRAARRGAAPADERGAGPARSRAAPRARSRPTRRDAMSKLTIVNPIAQAQAETADAERIPAARRPASLDGLTVGLYWNGKNLGDIALARAREHLAAGFPGVKFLDVFGEKGGLNRYLSPAQLDQMERECDVAIGTTADCGSCTSWLMRDMVE